MSYVLIKRVLDVVLAILVLIAMAPLALVVAMLVGLSSPGPILFKQERVGRFGESFRLLKFRSMRVDLDGPSITSLGDNRITRVGAFLRRSKLDEIPQIINVLVGDMSFVGPRPEVPEYVALYPEDLRSKVLSVRPGITDFASIHFIDEESILSSSENPQESYVRDILPRKLSFYSDYVDRQSLRLDLAILFKTLFAVFARRRINGPTVHQAKKN